MTVRVIDSHTGGEPTRLVVSGGPSLSGSLPERLAQLRGTHDWFRSAVVNEPRGSAVLVGALLLAPDDGANIAAVIFFNNVGYLGMCGHGTIGIIATLAWMGRLKPGTHQLETPVGPVTAALADDGAVTVTNVPAYVYRSGVRVRVEGLGELTGDIAFGGNWFFIVDWPRAPELSEASALIALTTRISQALEQARITGARGARIDHIELSGPALAPQNDGRNFVLCPGLAYDRSPCGTGTSAKIACLANKGKLAPGQVWRQEAVTGSVFEAWYDARLDDANLSIIPNIRGRAWVTADSQLIFADDDPLRAGLRCATG